VTTKVKAKTGTGTNLRPLWKKGQRPVGRAKGVKNKFTVRLKEAILEAAEKSGSNGRGKGGTVGYLVWLSRAEPAVYGRMLEKIMPMQIDVKDTTNKTLTPEEAAERLRERGLPVPENLLELTAIRVGETELQAQEDEIDDSEIDGSETEATDEEEIA
jgi:hypothetical protein